MSQDRARDLSPSDLPEPVGEWLAEVAAERGIEEEELLGRLLATADGAEVSEVEDRLDALEDRLEAMEERDVDALSDRVDQVAARTDELDAELDEKIEDVRQRVIQLKRELDDRAPEDHDHPQFERELEEIGTEVRELEDAVDDLRERLEAGAGGSEAVREEIEDVTGELDRKLNVLGSAVLDLRDRVSELGNYRSRRAVVERLQRAANRNGISSAECGSCGESIDVSLLSEPTCPHCEEDLRELDPKQGFFGSNVLRTGTPPPLEGDVLEEDLDGFVEE